MACSQFASPIFNPRFSFLAVLHADGRVAHLNQASLENSHLRADAVLGQLLWDTRWFQGSLQREAWPQRLREVRSSGQSFVGEEALLGGDGRRRLARVAVTPLALDGGGEFLLVEAQDLAEPARALAAPAAHERAHGARRLEGQAHAAWPQRAIGRRKLFHGPSQPPEGGRPARLVEAGGGDAAAWPGGRKAARLRTERARTQGDASLRGFALRLGKLATWTLDVETMMVRWSPQALALLALPAFPIALGRQLQPVQGEGRALLQAALDDCLSRGKPFDLEVAVGVRSGRTLWLRVAGEALPAEDGRIRVLHGAVQDVSERRHAAAEQQALGECLRQTLARITDAVCTLGRDGRFLNANPPAEKLFGAPFAELAGQVLWDRYPGTRHSVFHRQFRRALEENVTVRFEAYSEALGAWLSVVAYPTDAGLVVYFRDYTEARRAQEALRTSEEQYRLLFETSADAILQSDGQGRIVNANEAACTMFGLARSALLAMTRGQLLAPVPPDAPETAADDAGALRLRRGDGTEFHAELTASEFHTSGGRLLATTIIRDVTERHRHAQEMRRLNAMLGERVEQRTAELRRINEQLKSFAHSLAHDLRAPVLALQGFAGQLLERLQAIGTERDQQRARRILCGLARMDEFIDGLLSLASISDAELQVETVDFSAMAQAVIADLRESQRDRDVRVAIDEGLQAAGDRRLLRMCLENLLGNAWKFTARAQPAEIHFGSYTSVSGERVFFVKDNGAGFDMARAQHLFGNFQRLHAESDFPGTGVGLANVKRVLQRHGGRIWALAEEGRGATFFFTIGLLGSA